MSLTPLNCVTVTQTVIRNLLFLENSSSSTYTKNDAKL